MIVYVGCYTTPDRNGHGEGIAAYRMDPPSGEWHPLGLKARIANPSFLAVHPNGRNLYSVHGGELSDVSAFAMRGGSGDIELLETKPSGGVNPVHLDIQREGRWLAVANYTGSSIALLPIAADGCLGELSDLVHLTGEPGPDPVEQSTPHPHDIPFDPACEFVAVPDKGLDRVFIFRVDRENGRFVAADPPYISSAPGAGPRHIAFHPRQHWAYVINELNSTVTTYTYQPKGDAFAELQTVSSRPDNFTPKNTGAEIVVHPSGRFVYASNRGHNSVAAFAIDQQAGTLTSIGWTETHGDTPRSIALDPSGEFLYAANQASDTIVTFGVDTDTGQLIPTGEVISTGSPSSIVFTGGDR